MSVLKDLIKKAPVHERRLEMRTYPLGNDRLIVEGWLRDERFIKGYYWDGRARPEGVVHRMCIRLLVSGWPLSILDAEAEMPGVPLDLCPATGDSVKRIVGLSIVSGFSEKVRKLLGGVQGCAHLTYLIGAMGPAAVHGYWTQRSRKPVPLPRSLEEFPGIGTVINSCMLWKEDGPLTQEIRARLENRGDKQK